MTIVYIKATVMTVNQVLFPKFTHSETVMAFVIGFTDEIILMIIVGDSE